MRYLIFILTFVAIVTHSNPAHADMSDANVQTTIDLMQAGVIGPDQDLEVLSTLDIATPDQTSDQSED